MIRFRNFLARYFSKGGRLTRSIAEVGTNSHEANDFSTEHQDAYTRTPIACLTKEVDLIREDMEPAILNSFSTEIRAFMAQLLADDLFQAFDHHDQFLRHGLVVPHQRVFVPGIIKWPAGFKAAGLPAGTVSAEPIIGHDIFPTLLEIAGIPLPSDRVIDGTSIVPVFQHKTLKRERPLYWRNRKVI